MTSWCWWWPWQHGDTLPPPSPSPNPPSSSQPQALIPFHSPSILLIESQRLARRSDRAMYIGLPTPAASQAAGLGPLTCQPGGNRTLPPRLDENKPILPKRILSTTKELTQLTHSQHCCIPSGSIALCAGRIDRGWGWEEDQTELRQNSAAYAKPKWYSYRLPNYALVPSPSLRHGSTPSTNHMLLPSSFFSWKKKERNAIGRRNGFTVVFYSPCTVRCSPCLVQSLISAQNGRMEHSHTSKVSRARSVAASILLMSIVHEDVTVCASLLG